MDNLSYEQKKALLYELEEIAERYGLRQFDKVAYDALVASVLTKEPIVTKGNLTAGSNKVTIGGTGTGSVIGAGVTVDVAQSNLDHGSIGGLSDDDHTQYIKADATRALSADWDIGNARMIQADKIRARDGDGLALYEDGGAGIFIKDGGIVCVNNTDGFSGAGMLRITSDGSGNSLSMYRGVKVAGTEVNFVQLYLNNSVDAPQAYAAIGAGIVDPTDGAESGFLKFYTWKAGTFTVGVQIGQPTEGQLAVTGSIFANASQTDTVFAGNRSLDHGNIVGSDGYWAIRSSTANAICFDVYNGGAPITPLTILQNGNVGIGGAPTSKLQVVGLPAYANNVAAVAGGLTAGAFYRTGGDPDLVCVVH